MAHVLIIEPDRMLARTYRDALCAAGHAVVVCATAQSAIIAADASKPDVVIVELQLVNHSGIEFLYEFRSYPDWLSVPLLILTHVPPAEFAGSRELLRNELGMSEYLYKPHTNLKQLLRSVDELVSVQ